MIYCPVDEAFKKQTDLAISNDFSKSNEFEFNINNEQNMQYIHNFDNYSDININMPAFFTAQGDYTKSNGTTINELKNNNIDNESSLDFLNESYIPQKNINLQESNISKYKLDHKYCIDKIVMSLIDNSDNVSSSSSIDDDVYKHVKLCKYCKNKINQKMKTHYSKFDKKQENNIVVNEHFLNQYLGYDFKELLVIILFGIILIFILDLLVKIGKKMNKSLD